MVSLEVLSPSEAPITTNSNVYSQDTWKNISYIDSEFPTFSFYKRSFLLMGQRENRNSHWTFPVPFVLLKVFYIICHLSSQCFLSLFNMSAHLASPQLQQPLLQVPCGSLVTRSPCAYGLDQNATILYRGIRTPEHSVPLCKELTVQRWNKNQPARWNQKPMETRQFWPFWQTILSTSEHITFHLVSHCLII